jgi:hypothetical protein
MSSVSINPIGFLTDLPDVIVTDSLCPVDHSPLLHWTKWTVVVGLEVDTSCGSGTRDLPSNFFLSDGWWVAAGFVMQHGQILKPFEFCVCKSHLL